MLGTIPVKLFFKPGFTGSKCKLQMFLYRYPGSVDDYWKRFHEMTHWAIIKGEEN